MGEDGGCKENWAKGRRGGSQEPRNLGLDKGKRVRDGDKKQSIGGSLLGFRAG